MLSKVVVQATTGRLDEQAPLLSMLREDTREWHQRVEAKLQPAGDWTLTGYAAMLQAFHEVIGPLEPRLGDLLGDVFTSPPPLSRTDRIRTDLELLGRDTSPMSGASQLRVKSLPDAYGIGYVVQGSLLGGAVIVRQLRKASSSHPVPTTYLGLYGDELAGAWRRFCHALNSFGQTITHDERHHTIQAAINTFRAFERALDQHS